MSLRSDSTSHWPDMARLWTQLGSPLRPPPEVVCFYAKTLQRWAQDSTVPPRVLILGVTIEIYHLPWPSGTHLLALDHSGGMIDAVWPGTRSTAICGDWKAIPLVSNSQNIVFCDGGISVLAYLHETRRMIESLERVLAPDGICAFRLYTPPAKQESPDSVLADFVGGRIANLNLLKLRLGMAMQKDVCDGVQLQDIWNAINAAAPDFEMLCSQIGWKLQHLMAINTYRNSRVRYYFPTMAQVLELFQERNGAFKLEEVHYATYPLGERCPMVALRRVR
jgi:SAM-dependent methyltransferase